MNPYRDTPKTVGVPSGLRKQIQGLRRTGALPLRGPAASVCLMIRNPKRRLDRERPGSTNEEAPPTNEEIIRYFEERTRRRSIVKTTRTPSGQVLDWIPLESQNSKGLLAAPPPQSFIPASTRTGVKLASFELDDNTVELGPSGTVPVLRKETSRLHTTCSLHEYLSKRDGRKSRWFQSVDDPLPPNPSGSYFYGKAGQSFRSCFGCEGLLNVWQPYVEYSNDHSLMQTWLLNYDNSTTQSLEAGWTVDHSVNGDWDSHLFTFYTTNGYTKAGNDLGGYNQDVDGWQQYDVNVFPGALIVGKSSQGGNQVGIVIKFQLFEGNWWLQVQGRHHGDHRRSG